MPIRFYLSGLFLLLVLSSCKTDFDLNDKWKEINVIYGLLNKDDSVHYIRVEKAFLNNNESAYKVAQNADSIYHQDSIVVKLQEMNGDVVKKEIVLEKVFDTTKDAGTFAYPGQYLYRNPQPYKLDPGAVYKVDVKNATSGVESWATTDIVNAIQPGYPSAQIDVLNFLEKQLGFYFSTGNGAKFYDMNVLIHYTEYPDQDTSKPGIQKELNWPIFSYEVLPTTNAGQIIRFNVQTEEFFKLLHEHLDLNKTVSRKIGKLDVSISGGGEEIYYYIQVNKPSIGVVQKKPEYTNIQNGLGIFSSRSNWERSYRMSGKSIDYLVSDPSQRDLGFVK